LISVCLAQPGVFVALKACIPWINRLLVLKGLFVIPLQIRKLNLIGFALKDLLADLAQRLRLSLITLVLLGIFATLVQRFH
jgi:uncharacterized Tic20 family protein